MTDSTEVLNQLRIDRRGRAPRRRRWPWWLGGAVLVVGGLMAFGASRPLPVDTVAARTAATDGPTSVLDASGYVTARRTATVSSKVTGKVVEVRIEEGQRVAEGDVLARLDDTDAQAQLALAEAQLAAARAQRDELRAQIDFSEKTLVRQRELRARGLVAQSALDQAESELATLRARADTAERAIQVSQDSLALTRIGVDNTVVRAPFAGVIVAKAAQPGEMISPISAGGGFTRTGIGTLVDMDSLEVQVDVNEAYIGRVAPGMPIEAVLNAYPDWRIPGSVIAIVPTADRSKATVKVRVALDSRDARIVPDMGVRVSFLERPEPGAAPLAGVWVPARALVETDDGSAVFVLREQALARVPVTTAERRDADVRIEGALQAGEAVVIAPLERARDGARAVAKQP